MLRRLGNQPRGHHRDRDPGDRRGFNPLPEQRDVERAEFGVERANLALFGKLWYRIPKNDQDDNNPDITDYYGHGEISALYQWRGNSFSAGLRGNVSTGKGAVQLAWTSPPLLGPLRGYVQLFSGYGESLIDYNWRQTTIGARIALSDGL